MMNKTIFQKPSIIIFLLAIILAVIASLVILRPAVDQPAPNITFVLIDGNRLALDQLRGRPVLVSFWATTCKICIAKTPEMNALYQRLKPQGLEMVAVAMPYDPPTHVVKVAQKLKMPYPVALDHKGEAVRAFGNVKVTPTTILISADGKIVWRNYGKFSVKRLEMRILGLLQHGKTI